MKATYFCVTPVLALLLIFHLNPADAVADIITKTWTYEITDVDGNFVETVYGSGEVGQFTATYDDESLQANRFNEGPNGIPFDLDDVDTLAHTNNGDLIADLQDFEWDFGQAFMNYLTMRMMPEDMNQKLFVYDEANDRDMVIMSDNTSITITGEIERETVSVWSFNLEDEVGKQWSLYYFNMETIGDNDSVQYNLNIIAGTITNIETTSEMEPVPEPATMLLFGTGLAGLAGYRKRKAKK